MGIILNDYFKYIETSKDVLPDEVYETLITMRSTKEEEFKANSLDREKYFIEGFEELSQAIFEFLHSSRGPYVMGYLSEYKVNRLSAGFKTKEDLAHFSIWIIQRFQNNKKSIMSDWESQRKKDLSKTKKELLENVLAKSKVENKIRQLMYDMKTPGDFKERLALIELSKEYKCLAFDILNSYQYYKQLDNIHIALSDVNNVHLLNIAPEPIEQNQWERSRV